MTSNTHFLPLRMSKHSRTTHLSAAFTAAAFLLLSVVTAQYGISSSDVAQLQALDQSTHLSSVGQVGR